MSKKLPSVKPPRDYNSGTIGRDLNRIVTAVNHIGQSVDGFNDTINRARIDIKREVVSEALYNATLVVITEWEEEEDGDTIYAVGRFSFAAGWSRVDNVQWRVATTNDGRGNIDSAQAWADWDDGTGRMSFVSNENYKGGGYYQYRYQMEVLKGTQKHAVQIRMLSAVGSVLYNGINLFDPDKFPEILSIDYSWGNWSEGSKTWDLLVQGNCDNDTGSIAFNAQITSDFDTDSVLAGNSDADFVLPATIPDLTGTDKRFEVNLGSFAASATTSDVPVYIIGKTYTGANKSGTGKGVPYYRHKMIVPRDPVETGLISAEELTAQQLEKTARSILVAIDGRHKSGSENASIEYRGTLTYYNGGDFSMAGDGTTWQTLTPLTSNLTYIFFDDAAWVGEGTGTAGTQLQLTTDPEKAKAHSGNRRLIGLMQTTTAPEYAFFVFTGDQPIVTAPMINVVDLWALNATIGGFDIGADYVRDAANTFGLASTVAVGDDVRFWAGNPFADRATAPFMVTEAGVVTATSATITGNISMTGASSLASSVLTISGTGRIEIGSSSPMAFGYDVDGGTNDGLWLNEYNYWYATGNDFKVGSSDDYMVWNGTKLSIFANSVEVFDSTGAGTFKNANVTDLTISGTLTLGLSGKITNSTGELYIDDNEMRFDNSGVSTASLASGGISIVNSGGLITTMLGGGVEFTDGLNTLEVTPYGITQSGGTFSLNSVTWPGNTGSGDFGKFLKYDSLGVAVWATPAELNKCLVSNISDVSVGNTGVETTLISATVRGSKNISANTVQTGSVISIVGRGYFTTKVVGGGSDEIVMRFKVGGVTIMTTGAFSLGFDALAGWWEFIGDATVDNAGATGTVWAQGIFRFYNDDAATYTDVAIVKTAVSSAIDFTATATMDFTADWTQGDASNIITCTTLFVDLRHRA